MDPAAHSTLPRRSDECQVVKILSKIILRRGVRGKEGGLGRIPREAEVHTLTWVGKLMKENIFSSKLQTGTLSQGDISL